MKPTHYRPFGKAALCFSTPAVMAAWIAADRPTNRDPETTDIKNVTCQDCRQGIAEIVIGWGGA